MLYGEDLYSIEELYEGALIILLDEEELSLMATAEQLRDDRANAIVSYYNNRTTYFDMIDEDGDGTDPNDVQARFKAWQDLIIVHHDVLQSLYGFVTGSYLPDDEGSIETGEWWNNADTAEDQASMFWRDIESARSGSYLYKFNGQVTPMQYHANILWNQSHSIIGSVDDKSYKNADISYTYTNTYNPFSTGSNFRMKEPVEHYGNENSLVWGRVVHNGRYRYRNNYINDTSYGTTSDTGFTNLMISSKTNGIDGGSIWCSKWEQFRYTFWGGTTPVSKPAAIIYQTGGGWFRIDTNVSANWSVGSWYIMWYSGRGHAFRVTNVTVTEVEQGTDPPGYTYSYYTTIYYDNLIGHGSGINTTTYNVTQNGEIPEAYKLGVVGNGRDSLWAAVYNTYYSTFATRLDAISSTVESIIVDLADITGYDYTIINDDTGQVDPGSSDAQDLIDDLTTWLGEYKTLINDTGSGATYAMRESKWSDASMNALQTKLQELVNFTSGYTAYDTSIIGDYRDTIATLLGDYNKGADEYWNPTTVKNAQYNNTGGLTGGFYYWRYSYIDQRLNIEDGVLTVELNAYRTYLRKLDEIQRIEDLLVEIIQDNEYDLIPEDVEASLDEEDFIELSWEDTKAATSYYIERKEGISGSWTILDTDYGYVDPNGPPPDFSNQPMATYVDPAYIRGSQEFGLAIADPEGATGLTDNFTIYDFYMDVDGTGNQHVELRGMDCQSWEALAKTINDDYEDQIECEVANSDIRITTLTKGAGGSIALSAGTTNDLFAALSTTPDIAISGQTFLEQGKVYYYRLKLNNGYNTVMGGGDEDAKDWDSQSEYQLVNYSSDRRDNGDAGMITWDFVTGIVASGVEGGLTGSDTHVRIEWNSVPNVDHYKVYRATSEDGGYVPIDTTSNTYYEDTSAIPGFIYWYRIKSVTTTDHQLYDENDDFVGAFEGILSDERVQGKKLWQTITLEASRDDFERITLSWDSLSGATGYTIWVAKSEGGPYMYIPEDDVSQKVVNGLTYEDEYSARQFFTETYVSPSDGIQDTEYDASRRYYFQLIVTNPTTLENDVAEYYITSPASGTWTAQQIADDLDATMVNASCDLYPKEMPNTGEVQYYLRVKSDLQGVQAGVGLLEANPDFRERDLITLLGGVNNPVDGGGAYPVVDYWYKVKGVEVISGEIVRESEFSNAANGIRPLPPYST